jgi:type I restriction enzyme, S subunit
VGEWRKTTLGALVAHAGGFVRTGPFGSQLHAQEYTDDPGGVPVIMPKDMAGGRVMRATVSRVDSTVADRLAGHRLAAGDLVLARRGDIGRYAFIEDDETGWLCGTGALRVHAPDATKLAPRFLRYAMASPDVVAWLQGRAVGATMPNLNAGIVEALPITVPETEIQSRVAAVLSAFDELIEVNERRIELLDGFTSSLYREWFARLRFPGSEKGADAEAIPQGWITTRLADVATVNAKTARVRDLPDPLDYIDISSVSPRRIESATRTPSDEAPGRARRVISDGDTLWAMVRPNRRSHALVHDPPPSAIASTGFAVLTPREVPAAFLFEYSSRQEFTDYLMGRATGAAYPAVRPTDFEEAPILIPPQALLMAFADAADPVLRLVSHLIETNRALARTRDLLLPRLVTGQLDIADVDLSRLTPAAAN